MNMHVKPEESALIPRASVETIIRHRNVAIALFGEAHQALLLAAEARDKAGKAIRIAAPLKRNRYNHHSEAAEKVFLSGIKVADRKEYMEVARKLVDTDVWAHIIEITDLERLMDKKAKDQFYRQLLDDPPEATVDNIFATLEQFALDADMIFRRGIAEAFSNLDRRFRSHDGWKIGSRVILNGAFSDSGHWNYYRNERDTLTDIERTFMRLDGEAAPLSYAGIVGVIEHARGSRYGARQTECENDYFLIRCYKNGNAHIWFKRDDLLVKVNKLLAEYYGEVIPEEREPDEDTGLRDPKTALAKNYGFFPTPDKAAKELIDKLPLYREKGEPPLTVLEPSAGDGNLARLCAAKQTGTDGGWGSGKEQTKYHYRALVDCVEVQPILAAALKAERIYRKVHCCDFLALQPDPNNLYDRVVMNPPFDRERDIDHVMHALEFLKPDGFLTAIMSAGTEFRETKKSIAFRELMAKMNARWSDLPAGSFSSVGTNINTITLRVWKNGRSFY